jgi:hypothetical protein
MSRFIIKSLLTQQAAGLFFLRPILEEYTSEDELQRIIRKMNALWDRVTQDKCKAGVPAIRFAQVSEDREDCILVGIHLASGRDMDPDPAGQLRLSITNGMLSLPARAWDSVNKYYVEEVTRAGKLREHADLLHPFMRADEYEQLDGYLKFLEATTEASARAFQFTMDVTDDGIEITTSIQNTDKVYTRFTLIVS